MQIQMHRLAEDGGSQQKQASVVEAEDFFLEMIKKKILKHSSLVKDMLILPVVKVRTPLNFEKRHTLQWDISRQAQASRLQVKDLIIALFYDQELSTLLLSTKEPS